MPPFCDICKTYHSPLCVAEPPYSALDIFREQAVTISKHGSEVTIRCGDAEDAETIFHWLSSLGAS